MSTLRGQWQDGRSTATREVCLERAAADMLRLRFDDGDSLEWPFAAIDLSPRLGSTPRLLRRPGHGQVECAHSPLLEAWFPRPASRVEAFADWLERRRAAIVLAVVATVVAIVAFFHLGVPWMAEQAAERMPVAVERAASEQVWALLDRLYLEPTQLPAARRARLSRAFEAMVFGEPRSGQMRVLFAHAPEIGPNALALPDGRLVVTDALVELAADDTEILAVLAHEAGHHVHRHGMRRALEGASVMLVAGLAFGDASGSSLAVSIPATLLGTAFSRGHETEADAYALDLLARRGIAPEAFATILARISALTGAGDESVLDYLSSHPPTARRIEAARRAEQGIGAAAEAAAGVGSPADAEPGTRRGGD